MRYLTSRAARGFMPASMLPASVSAPPVLTHGAADPAPGAGDPGWGSDAPSGWPHASAAENHPAETNGAHRRGDPQRQAVVTPPLCYTPNEASPLESPGRHTSSVPPPPPPEESPATPVGDGLSASCPSACLAHQDAVDRWWRRSMQTKGGGPPPLPDEAPPDGLRRIVPQVLPRSTDFDHKKQLGKGRFGTASLARCVDSGADVCLKRLRYHSDDPHVDPCEEIRLHGLAQWHPHVVGFGGWFLDNQDAVLILEACRGGTLYHKLKRLPCGRGQGRGLPLARVARYAYQLLSAVAHLHRLGITHRDVKAENVLLTNGQSDLRLCDFGFAIHASRGTLTHAVGTKCHFSPELWDCVDSKPGSVYGPPADVWATGVVLFEAAAGRLPFGVDMPPHTDLTCVRRIRTAPAELDTNATPLSSGALAFLQLLLNRDSSTRITAEAALKHPWLALRKRFQEGGPRPEEQQESLSAGVRGGRAAVRSRTPNPNWRSAQTAAAEDVTQRRRAHASPQAGARGGRQHTLTYGAPEAPQLPQGAPSHRDAGAPGGAAGRSRTPVMHRGKSPRSAATSTQARPIRAGSPGATIGRAQPPARRPYSPPAAVRAPGRWVTGPTAQPARLQGMSTPRAGAVPAGASLTPALAGPGRDTPGHRAHTALLARPTPPGGTADGPPHWVGQGPQRRRSPMPPQRQLRQYSPPRTEGPPYAWAAASDESPSGGLTASEEAGAANGHRPGRKGATSPVAGRRRRSAGASTGSGRLTPPPGQKPRAARGARRPPPA